MGGFSFPAASNTPRYQDVSLGPTDRVRSWTGWTKEASPLIGPPAKMLRNENGTLLYGGNSPYATVEDFPVVVDE